MRCLCYVAIVRERASPPRLVDIRLSEVSDAELDSVVFQELLVGATGALASLVRVVQQHLIGRRCSRAVVSAANVRVSVECGFIAQPAIRRTVQVQNRGQVQPAFLGRNVGDVCQPDLVGPLRGEVPLQEVRGR